MAGMQPGAPGSRAIVPAIWLAYVAIVFEILFMISPAALYYYSTYGPSLNFLHGSPATAWLTQFFLPHFSSTANPALDSLRGVGQLLMLVGLGLFLAGFVQIYWAKLRGREAVVAGLYRWARHPQYTALAILGLGTLLVWPRFTVLIGYLTMLFLYAWLARSEERNCLRRFGASYAAYLERTGMFLPLPRLPSLLPASGAKRVVAALALYVVVLAGAVAMAHGLRDWSLSGVSAVYRADLAALSPALLTSLEIDRAFEVAARGEGVRDRLAAEGADAKFLVYVVPESWRLPDLPMEDVPHAGGHYTPADFDRSLYKVLFTRVRTHDPAASGPEIVKRAYSRDPLLLVHVDTATGVVTGIETPPAHVQWGDIPTPMF
jgi:protein-S-isoprenylcysteine O-methyltransferase Ste14